MKLPIRIAVARVNARTFALAAVGALFVATGCEGPGGLVNPTDTTVASVTVTGQPASLQVGESVRLTATATNASGEELRQKNFIWTSSNDAVATVDESGVVTGRGPGSATITATSEQKPGSMTITVSALPAISLSPQDVKLSVLAGRSATDSVRITNGGGGTLGGLTGVVTYGAGQPIGWLTATLRSTTAPATLVLEANAANLQPGTYNANVTLRSSQSGVAERSVSVTFTVGAGPAIGLSATTISFAAVAGEASPAAQTVAVTNAGGGTLSGLSGVVTYGAGQPTGWLTAALSSTTAPATLTLTANTTGLAAGTYNATVTIRSSVAGVADRSVNVTLTVAAQPVPIISVSESTVSFSATAGQTSVPPRTVTITNAGPGTLTRLSGVVTYPLDQPAGWLTAALSSTSAPATLTLTVNAANLQPGTYGASVILRSSISGVADKSVNVTFTVTLAPVASLRIEPDSAGIQVGGTVDLNAVALSASGAVLTGRTVTWTSLNTAVATVSSTGVVTGVAPGKVTIRATSEGVTANAVVTVTAAPQPQIGVSPSSITFSATAGQSNPASQTVSVTNTGEGTLSGLSGTVTYASGQPTGWLTAALSSTTAPATLTLTANTAGLAAGTYNATVTIRSSLSGVAERTVNVTLTVTAAPQPQIGVSPSSITFSATAGQSNPASQTVSVTNIGNGTLSGLSTSIAYTAGQPTGWLTASLSSTTAPATLTLSAATGALAAGTYTATVTVASSVSGVTPKMVTVTFTVAAAPAPVIAVPTNLTARTVSTGPPSTRGIELEWRDNATNETRYEVYRSTTTGFSPSDATRIRADLPANTTTYLDNTGLNTGTVYYYLLRACNAAGCSASSNQANATAQ